MRALLSNKNGIFPLLKKVNNSIATKLCANLLNNHKKSGPSFMGKLGSNNTKNIGMLPSASKYVSIKFEDQCLHILNNKERFNGLKDSIKMQKI